MLAIIFGMKSARISSSTTLHPFEVPKKQEPSNYVKITGVVLGVLLLLGCAAAIAVGVVYTMSAVWISGVCVSAVALLILACSCCCDEEKRPPPQRTTLPPPPEPPIVKSDSGSSLPKEEPLLNKPTTSSTSSTKKEDPPAISTTFLKSLDEKTLALTQGKYILEVYRNPADHQKELADIKKCEAHVLKSILRFWNDIPDKTKDDDIVGFICADLILPYEYKSEIKQGKRILRLIRLLDDIKFDFSLLFKRLISWSFPQQTILRELLPRLYLESSLRITEGARKQQRLNAFFADSSAASILLPLVKQLPPTQKAELKQYLETQDSKRVLTCLELLS
jgi:hypothetical protein